MPAFKRDSASRLRDAERCMKGGEPLTMREASFISSLMGHAQHIDAATVRFTMHIDGSLDGQINLKSEYLSDPLFQWTGKSPSVSAKCSEVSCSADVSFGSF